jgi:hypothetical protein
MKVTLYESQSPFHCAVFSYKAEKRLLKSVGRLCGKELLRITRGQIYLGEKECLAGYYECRRRRVGPM